MNGPQTEKPGIPSNNALHGIAEFDSLAKNEERIREMFSQDGALILRVFVSQNLIENFVAAAKLLMLDRLSALVHRFQGLTPMRLLGA